MIRKQRPTIGFLSANIDTGASRVLWPGVLDAAEAADVNLICFPGGCLYSSENFDAQRNLIFDLVNDEQLDGLVSWTSALAGGGNVTPEDIVDFHRQYRALPVVSLAQSIERGPLVSIDGYQGMQTLVTHLVDVHGYQHIALICGPEGHLYAHQRYQAFVDALKEKGLSPDPDLITPMLGWEKGAEAMRTLLDERKKVPGVDFQAVVAVSDLLAIGALNILIERGIRVPLDVAVVGFNDIEEGRLVRPPLTSVSLPFYEQGRQCVETMMSILAGKEVPDEVMLDSRLLVRQSCGCPSQSVNLAVMGNPDQDGHDPRKALRRAQEQLLAQISRVIRNKGMATTWAKQLIDAFRSEIDGDVRGQFRSTLDGILKQGALDGDETTAWQNAISILRREMLPTFGLERQARAEDLFGQARVVIGEAIQRTQATRQVQDAQQNHALREIGQALITTFEINKLADVLTERMPELGIRGCYLALYEDPAESTEWSRLVLAYSDGKRLALEPDGRRYRSRQVVPPELLPDRRYSLVVEPLFFQTDSIGFVVFEVGPYDGDIYEVLRGHISSALKGALLFREVDDARQVAERADQIKTRLLTNVSHELRTPLNIIIQHSKRNLDIPQPELAMDLEHIKSSAEHQLRIINDLLDLSRAEINALDLYPECIDTPALIEEAFAALAQNAAESDAVTWRLELQPDIPQIKADPVRLRQILLNLLSNAARFTERGQITLGAEVAAPYLHIWVADTGIGIRPELVERIYEPFFTHQYMEGERRGGIGLGLSITKHLVALHHGVITLDSQPGRGSTFHVYLPLPEPEDQSKAALQMQEATLWFISNVEEIPVEIVEFGRSHQLTVQRLHPKTDLEALFAKTLPAVVAWNISDIQPDDWVLIRRLHNHPQMAQIPFILFQEELDGGIPAGLTSLVVKPAGNQALWEAIRQSIPGSNNGSVLIIDDDEQARRAAYEVVSEGLPEYSIRTAVDGETGLAAMLVDPPSLVILDLMMPYMDGFEVLDQMRADERTWGVPVVILSNRQLSMGDIKRLEQHAAVTLQSKEILSDEEIIVSLHRAVFGSDTLPLETSALVKQAIAFIHQNYGRAFGRSELAEFVGMSEDYLGRVFKQELGISPWDYLNRYRIYQARKLLLQTHKSVSRIAKRVGFSDPAYFSRVFRKHVGISPSDYRIAANW